MYIPAAGYMQIDGKKKLLRRHCWSHDTKRYAARCCNCVWYVGTDLVEIPSSVLLRLIDLANLLHVCTLKTPVCGLRGCPLAVCARTASQSKLLNPTMYLEMSRDSDRVEKEKKIHQHPI